MGQAKARGSKEQRVAEGIEKSRLRKEAYQAELAARKAKDAEYLASLSEDERVNLLAKRAFLRQLMSMGNSHLFP